MNSVRTGKAQMTVQQDGICCSSTKYHWTKTQGGTNALGQWVSWAAQPWHTLTWGSEGGAGWAQPGGRRTSLASPSGLEGLSH